MPENNAAFLDTLHCIGVKWNTYLICLKYQRRRVVDELLHCLWMVVFRSKMEWRVPILKSERNTVGINKLTYNQGNLQGKNRRSLQAIDRRTLSRQEKIMKRWMENDFWGHAFPNILQGQLFISFKLFSSNCLEGLEGNFFIYYFANMRWVFLR